MIILDGLMGKKDSTVLSRTYIMFDAAKLVI